MQIAASVQKQQGSYRAVIIVHPEGHSNNDLTIVWCAILLSKSHSRLSLEGMKCVELWS